MWIPLQIKNFVSLHYIGHDFDEDDHNVATFIFEFQHNFC